VSTNDILRPSQRQVTSYVDRNGCTDLAPSMLVDPPSGPLLSLSFATERERRDQDDTEGVLVGRIGGSPAFPPLGMPLDEGAT
jgi:hypothetical protein